MGRKEKPRKEVAGRPWGGCQGESWLDEKKKSPAHIPGKKVEKRARKRGGVKSWEDMVPDDKWEKSSSSGGAECKGNLEKEKIDDGCQK